MTKFKKLSKSQIETQKKEAKIEAPLLNSAEMANEDAAEILAKKANEQKANEQKVNEEIVNEQKAIAAVKAKIEQIKIAQKELNDLKKELPGGIIIRHGAGVIASIAELLTSSKKGISKVEILAKLMEKFPERGEAQMRATISVQVPSRINKERFELEKLEGGLFRAKEENAKK